MACKNVCKLCNRFIISTNVTFVTNVGLVIQIPAGTYNSGEKYCIVIAQAIPIDTPVSAPVLIQIGTGTTRYPVVGNNCMPLTVCNVRTRTKYSMKLLTNMTSAIFKMLGCTCCQKSDCLGSIS